jgi:hypothetical protein
MPHHLRSLLLIALIIALPLPVGVQAAPPLGAGVEAARPLGIGVQPAPVGPTAPDAANWYDGLIQYSTITNCVSIMEKGNPRLCRGDLKSLTNPGVV